MLKECLDFILSVLFLFNIIILCKLQADVDFLKNGKRKCNLNRGKGMEKGGKI